MEAFLQEDKATDMKEKNFPGELCETPKEKVVEDLEIRRPEASILRHIWKLEYVCPGWFSVGGLGKELCAAKQGFPDF